MIPTYIMALYYAYFEQPKIAMQYYNKIDYKISKLQADQMKLPYDSLRWIKLNNCFSGFTHIYLSK